MRVIASSIRAALIITALFWGNCLTCPQALMAQAHRCCHKTSKSSTTCQTQSLRQFVKADSSVQQTAVPTAAVLVEAVATSPAPVPVFDSAAIPDAAEHAPPDLFSLHSSYRI
jgi:hypothetical protein